VFFGIKVVDAWQNLKERGSVRTCPFFIVKNSCKKDKGLEGPYLFRCEKQQERCAKAFGIKWNGNSNEKKEVCTSRKLSNEETHMNVGKNKEGRIFWLKGWGGPS